MNPTNKERVTVPGELVRFAGALLSDAETLD
jgi:hypothetical protein